MEIGKIVTLLPCGGVRRLNTPANHVYVLYGDNGSAEAFTKEQAGQRFGDGGYRVAISHTVCPSCYEEAFEKHGSEIERPYSKDTLHSLIANNVGGVRALVEIGRKHNESGYDFGMLRDAQQDFESGVRGLIARISQGQVVVSGGVGVGELGRLLELSQSLNWQGIGDDTWQGIGEEYRKITGEVILG